MNEINIENNNIVPVSGPTPTSTNISMEMISGGSVVHDDGRVEPVYVVHFTTGNGHHFYYPWKGLKETVLNWVRIEGEVRAENAKNSSL
jgi:hypothetical protein